MNPKQHSKLLDLLFIFKEIDWVKISDVPILLSIIDEHSNKTMYSDSATSWPWCNLFPDYLLLAPSLCN
jgi:hypothetical protein